MKENSYGNTDSEAYRIAYLIAGYIRNTLTEKEHDELDEWVAANDHNMELFEDLTDENNLRANLEWMDKVQSDETFKKLQETGSFDKPARRIAINPLLIAAAMAILIAGIYFIREFTGNRSPAKTQAFLVDTTELQPGGNKATLTLADGSVIDLTASKKGVLKKDKNFNITKQEDGEIVYEAEGNAGNTSALHILSTPVGGQFRIVLPDGTKVWLNAATALRYPARFSSKERKVEVEGEAYFEVAKKNSQPFRVVLADSTEVTVLGTHFNVMAYRNDQSNEITLLEGSVSIVKGNKSHKLEPGMQARVTNNEITIQRGTDTSEITGWKNGLFVFHDAPIESVMRQVERWYDARIVYQGAIAQQFNATILRSESLTKLLHLLELTGYVHFKIENKTIYVQP